MMIMMMIFLWEVIFLWKILTTVCVFSEWFRQSHATWRYSTWTCQSCKCYQGYSCSSSCVVHVHTVLEQRDLSVIHERYFTGFVYTPFQGYVSMQFQCQAMVGFKHILACSRAHLTYRQPHFISWVNLDTHHYPTIGHMFSQRIELSSQCVCKLKYPGCIHCSSVLCYVRETIMF